MTGLLPPPSWSQGVPQDELPPRERLYSLPLGLPAHSVGLHVAQWMMENLVQPSGDRAGEPFVPTRSQIEFLIQWYAFHKASDGTFRFDYRRGMRMQSKGSGKSPFNAALVLAELCGPVRPQRVDPDVPFGVVAVPEPAPLIHVAATSERQTATTMRQVRLFTGRGAPVRERYGLEVGKTYVDTPMGGRIEQVASSAGSLEGFELTFAVAEETEHWLPSIGGPGVMQTILRNTGKTRYGRVLETCNAPEPGEDSVAEATYDDWVAQEEGRKRSQTKVLMDSRTAPYSTVMHDEPGEGEVGITEALGYLYADCPWVSVPKVRETVWDRTVPESVSRRFYLNQLVATEDAWCTQEEWTRLADRSRTLQKGEDIVMFFDGSKSNDHTALVACAMDDGFIHPLGVWEPRESTGEVDVDAVDSAVRRARDTYNVVAFFADVREWESYAHQVWPEMFKDSLLVPSARDRSSWVAWDMRGHSLKFAEAAERVIDEIREGAFRHSGDARLTEHVLNARVHEYRGRFTVRKASPKSPRKIDACVCMIGARMVYNIVKDSPLWKRRSGGAGQWRWF